MRLNIKADDRMAVSLQNTTTITLLIAMARKLIKQKVMSGVKSLRTLGTILFGRLSLLMEVPTLKSSSLSLMELVPPNRPEQTHSQ